jgi:NADPH:quinone reductase
MRAVVVHQLGGPEVLSIGEAPEPQPRSGEVLVRLEATGVNFAETERRRGVYDVPALPWIPGKEAAGTVVATGDAVDPAWAGRRVAFWTPRASGTYAELATAPAADLFRLPDTLAADMGAALPLQGLTAYGLVHRAARIEPGMTVLVHAAAGGVGSLLVQLLVRRGARVIGTASSEEKRRFVESLGATALAYADDLPAAVRSVTGGNGVDLVYDSVGRATQAASLDSLSTHGRVIFYGEASGPPTPVAVTDLYRRSRGLAAFVLQVEPVADWSEARRELLNLAATGALRLEISGRWPLERAAEVHRLLESRATLGKLLLVP